MSSHDTSRTNTDFITWRLAEWAAHLSYESLSEQAIHTAKLFLFDSFGCALAPGVDGVTVAEYAENLEANLAELLEQAKSGR